MTVWNMRKYRFLLTLILSSTDIIVDSVLIRENTGKWKTVFSHILCSDVFSKNIWINLEVVYRVYQLIYSWLVNYGITWLLGFKKPRTKISRMWSPGIKFVHNLFLSQLIYLISYYNYFTNYDLLVIFSYAECDFFKRCRNKSNKDKDG